MKKILLYTIFIIILLAGIGIVAYPFVSNYLNSLNCDSAVMQYLSISGNTETDFSDVLESAYEYNRELAKTSSVVSDPFSDSHKDNMDYMSQLCVDGSEVMATVEIKAIDVSLPVYHGTSEAVLKKGAGHLSNSSLPVGGDGTHAVITGHTGYSAMRLFTDLNKLVQGDIITINVCGEVLNYKVDNIATVLPHETDLLQIDPEKDYVTLVTCTPFGVNSHRLLVRGVRVSDEEAQSILENHTQPKESTWTSEYMYAIIMGIIVMVIILVVFFVTRFIIRACRKKKNEQ